MIAVPYDVWLHITSYLSPEEIWDIRHLSPALFDIALDARYRSVEVSMTFRRDKKYMDGFSRYRDPDIARRVRRLSYFPRATTYFPEEKSVKEPVGIMKRYLPSMFTNYFGSDTDTMVETMARFTNLVSLEIVCTTFDGFIFFPECLPLIHTNFRTCYSQLQSLSFSFHLARYPALILPDLFLPSLTNLSMTFSGDSSKTPFEDVARNTLVPFMNRHRNTLTSILLQTVPEENINMGFLFQNLDRISSLKTVFLSFSASTPPASIARVLVLHRTTLREITIGLIGRPYHRVDSIFQDVRERFPKLEEFSVECSQARRPYEPSLEATVDFIKRCSPSLVSLDIVDGELSRDKLREFLDPGTSQGVSFMKLTSLTIAIQVLTPDVMDLFASQIPNLRTLKLFAASLKSRENIPGAVIDHYEFCAKMGQRSYSSWKLEHLVVHLQHTGPITWATNNTSPIVFAKAIPSLKTFNGRPASEYPRSGLASSLLSE